MVRGLLNGKSDYNCAPKRILNIMHFFSMSFVCNFVSPKMLKARAGYVMY
jgi:hypothetical protein